MTWKLTGDGDHTRVQLSYSVGGFIVGGFDKIAPGVESVLNEQLTGSSCLPRPANQLASSKSRLSPSDVAATGVAARYRLPHSVQSLSGK